MNTEMQRRLIAPLVRGLLVCCLVGSSGFAAAAAITEVEPNDSVSSAQSIVPAEGLTISGVIGDTSGTTNTDVDFFTFEGTQGDTPVITSIGATTPDGAGGCLGFAIVVTLYDSSLNVVKEDTADCLTSREALIDNIALEATGTYYVAIAEWPHIGATGAVTQGMFYKTEGGDYQVVISGVNTPPPSTPPSVKHVPIRVRHWHQDERDLGKRNGRDPIVVAIMSMASFDATTVDANSLTFGATGHEMSLFRCRKNGVDINGDGRLDMVCYFKPDVASFQTDHRNGVLKGKTKSGQQIVGSAALKIFTMSSEKRGFKHHRKHGTGGDDRKNDKDNRKK